MTWELVCSELDDLENIKTEMKNELDAAKKEEETAKKTLEGEANKPENSKAAGQPLLATMDSILKKLWHRPWCTVWRGPCWTRVS